MLEVRLLAKLVMWHLTLVLANSSQLVGLITQPFYNMHNKRIIIYLWRAANTARVV